MPGGRIGGRKSPGNSISEIYPQLVWIKKKCIFVGESSLPYSGIADGLFNSLRVGVVPSPYFFLNIKKAVSGIPVTASIIYTLIIFSTPSKITPSWSKLLIRLFAVLYKGYASSWSSINHSSGFLLSHFFMAKAQSTQRHFI